MSMRMFLITLTLSVSPTFLQYNPLSYLAAPDNASPVFDTTQPYKELSGSSMAERIEARMEQLGTSPSDIVAATDESVSEGVLSYISEGGKEIQLRTLRDLSNALGVSAHWMITGELIEDISIPSERLEYWYQLRLEEKSVSVPWYVTPEERSIRLWVRELPRRHHHEINFNGYKKDRDFHKLERVPGRKIILGVWRLIMAWSFRDGPYQVRDELDRAELNLLDNRGLERVHTLRTLRYMAQKYYDMPIDFIIRTEWAENAIPMEVKVAVTQEYILSLERQRVGAEGHLIGLNL